MPATHSLTFDQLRNAVRGEAAAVRLRIRLQPAGDNGAKVSPPTYQGGVYATEKRRVVDKDNKAKELPCVLLDSVQSQANRLEQALLDAFRAGKLELPDCSAWISRRTCRRLAKSRPWMPHIGSQMRSSATASLAENRSGRNRRPAAGGTQRNPLRRANGLPRRRCGMLHRFLNCVRQP